MLLFPSVTLVVEICPLGLDLQTLELLVGEGEVLLVRGARLVGAREVGDPQTLLGRQAAVPAQVDHVLAQLVPGAKINGPKLFDFRWK